MFSAIFAEHRNQQRAEILRVGRTDNNCQRVLNRRVREAERNAPFWERRLVCSAGASHTLLKSLNQHRAAHEIPYV